MHALDQAIDFELTRDLDSGSITKLVTRSEQLKEPIPMDPSEFRQWWRHNGDKWIEQLHQAITEHHHVSRDWKFTSIQMQRLQQYFGINKFLVELMKIEGSVSEECRTEIEEGLLLPWAELQHRQPHLYGELEV